MKKTLSILIALILALTLAVSSFAVNGISKDDVERQCDATVGYITNGITAYTVDTAIDYYYLVKSGNKATRYYEGFLQSVVENLEANDGKIVPLYGENMTTYAAVIGVIDAMDDDPRDVNSVDLTELLENADVTSISNPYHYNVVIPVITKYCEYECAKAVCDYFIENNYTVGSGMDYWGFAADNTAMFISAVAQSGDPSYEEILDDAAAVLETYKTDGGYCYNPEYGTAANVNSTGLALMAKCIYSIYKGTAEENLEELESLYSDLLTFKGETEGSFAYDGVESTYSAADALRGISAFYTVLSLVYPDVTEPEIPTEDITDENPVPEKPVSEKPVSEKPVSGNTVTDKPSMDKNPDIPDTGSELSITVAGIAATAALFAISYTKKKKD